MAIRLNDSSDSSGMSRALSKSSNALSKSLERLASGKKINKAGDDAAGLQIAEKLISQFSGTQKALSNIQDGGGVLNVADEALGSTQDNLTRMRELTVQAASDTLGTDERNAIQQEINQLSSEITRTSDATTFNGKKLLDGSTTSYNITTGPNSSDSVDIAAGGAFNSADASTLQVDSANVDVSSSAAALASLDKIDAAMDTVSARRASLGSMSNRLEGAANNLAVSLENTASSLSRIRDVDVASESSKMTMNMILRKATTALKAQSNHNSEVAARLLK